MSSLLTKNSQSFSFDRNIHTGNLLTGPFLLPDFKLIWQQQIHTTSRQTVWKDGWWQTIRISDGLVGVNSNIYCSTMAVRVTRQEAGQFNSVHLINTDIMDPYGKKKTADGCVDHVLMAALVCVFQSVNKSWEWLFQPRGRLGLDIKLNIRIDK